MDRRDFIQSVGSALLVRAGARRQARPAGEFDYVVVGAGSSGCVVANRLSADPKVRVLLLEAGGADHTDSAILTPGRWVSLIGSRFDWGYSTEPDPGLAGRALRWPRGKIYGGSSAINAMAYVRGHARTFDEWASAGGSPWQYRQVLPIFKSLEQNSRGASEYRGAGGPQAVTDTVDPHAGHLAFLEAARELGYAADPAYDFNGPQQENGAGFYQKTIHHGQRQSAAAAFLTPVLSRPNLTVWPGTHVQRLLFTGNRATGLEVVRDGGSERINVAREIVLSAGVLESPKILMLSGIGPASVLKTHGIAVRLDVPGVGGNLHDHPRVSVRWKSLQTLPPSTVSAGLFVRSGGSFPGLSGRSESKAAPPVPIPDIQFYVGRGIDTPDDFITLTVALSVPTSRGTLTLRSADPLAPPVITPNYLREPSDLDALVEGVRLARALAGAKAYARLRGAPVDPQEDHPTVDHIRAFIRRAADTIFHPVGTCRMGTGPDAVIDGQLRVRGVQGVRVADASVMPTTVNSQTHAACLLIGEMAARFMK